MLVIAVDMFGMIFIMSLLLSMAGSAVESTTMGSAMVSTNSNFSMSETTMNQETPVTQWVQITVVPLGVFLLGACILGIIQNTAANLGNNCNEFGGGSPETDNQASTENYLISNVHDAQDVPFNPDLEEGLQLPHRLMDADGRTESNIPAGGEIPSSGIPVQTQL
ncbi:hypothetical protein M758_3G208600 [Ceratodon purpureus]|nr:hypothetical protein M758_3G208600 [Ceratodon purpureus]